MSIFDKVGNLAADAAQKVKDAANPPAQAETTSNTVNAASAGASAANVAAQGVKLKVTTQSSNLNIRNQPSTDGEIVGKAAHGESVTLVRRENDDWWVIRTDAGEEGYASSQYLTLE
jgi:uncharacterized protein YgiM (DUF1202 family)